MVRAIGSYPIGHKFESHRRYHDNNTEFSFYIWPVGQAVKTPPFHGGNMGSSPVRVTNEKDRIKSCLFCCVLPSGEPIGSREEQQSCDDALREASACGVSEIPVRRIRAKRADLHYTSARRSAIFDFY